MKDQYYIEREKKEKFLEELVDLCKQHELVLELTTNGNVTTYSTEQEEKMMYHLKWWK